MKATMKSGIAIGMIVALGGIALLARGQNATVRPGDPTQAHVWVENRAANDAVPVVVESLPSPVNVRIDQSNVVRTAAAIQNWDYRTVQVTGNWSAGNIGNLGNEGWEAVGIVPTSAGATILFKRPR
jgi:hypothetical protein